MAGKTASANKLEQQYFQMQIIPVIDLKDGHVVSARHGDRANYRPLNSPLCDSASIFDVVEAFLGLFAFNTFYIADLNAIERQGDHADLIAEVVSRYRHIEFWLDNGRQLASMEQRPLSNVVPVIGTESQHQIAETADTDYVLSLDFKADTRLGNQALFENAASWPQNIIIMTLEKVGSHAGPDLGRLAEYRQKHPDKHFIAAGGIRNTEDLRRLIDIGVGKALIASALHNGAIGSDEIENLQTKKYPG